MASSHFESLFEAATIAEAEYDSLEHLRGKWFCQRCRTLAFQSEASVRAEVTDCFGDFVFELTSQPIRLKREREGL